MDDTYILLASPQMTSLAKAVADDWSRRRDEMLRSSSRNDGSDPPTIKLGDIKWARFPDTFPDIFINRQKEVKRAHIAFLACFDTPDVIFEQMSVMYTLATYGPRSLRFLLPYYPTGTMERIDHEGQVATAHSLAQMLSAVAPAGPGPVPLYIWDIHALQIRHYFDTKSISPRFKSGISLLKELLSPEAHQRLKLGGRPDVGGIALATMPDPGNVTIAYPDSGAYKRFKTMFEDEDKKPLFPSIICYKQRQGTERKVKISEGDPAGRDVFIVDDLIHSGGTIIECQKVIAAAGAKTVSAYATHGVFEREAWRKFIGAGFERVIITDSCPTAAVLRGQAPFEILSLAPSIADIIVDR